MRLLIQRVSEASVDVDQKTIGSIHQGALVLLGVHKEDASSCIPKLVHKLIHLRMFTDEQNKMNRSLLEIQGSILVVSQFTLYADCRQGRRPSFVNAASPPEAHKLYEEFLRELRRSNLRVETGEFGANMQVRLTNDGPVTFLIES